MVTTPRSKKRSRVKVKTPGGRNVIHYKHKKPSKAKCAECGAVLAGVLNERPGKMQTAKTKKRPERPFGGKLCPKCSRRTIISSTRK